MRLYDGVVGTPFIYDRIRPLVVGGREARGSPSKRALSPRTTSVRSRRHAPCSRVCRTTSLTRRPSASCGSFTPLRGSAGWFFKTPVIVPGDRVSNLLVSLDCERYRREAEGFRALAGRAGMRVLGERVIHSSSDHGLESFFVMALRPVSVRTGT